ncbi:hypothetical protein V493_00282 [Pseudogymnoascus sp. VKM F-4281 (FW-2241)]|nr:hypothetical protein V493_00282 [Pseudogymnoascus sp. VKM F-4281 (FW-2241)]
MMSHFDGDEEFARMIQHELNANPRRSTVKSSPTPSNVWTPSQTKATPSTTHAASQPKKTPPKNIKCAQTKLSPHDCGFSELSSTDEEQVLSEFTPPSNSSSDSPQASPIVSPPSPEPNAEDDIDEPSSPEVPPQRLRKHRSPLVTNITIKDADARTDPPMGPDLLALAQRAWCHQFPERWNPEVARFVDGKWLAPDMCDNCRERGCAKCDRAFPCSLCVRHGKHCNPRTFMSKSTLTYSPQYDEAMTSLKLAARQVSQYGDGTWNVSKHTLPTGDLMKQKRKYAGASQATGNSPAKKRHTLPESGYRRTRSSSEETDIEDPANPGQSLVSPHRITSLQDSREGSLKKGRRVPRTYTYYHRSEQEGLPAPCGQPPVWASKRQQLCETLPYYKAYMSGAYLHDGLVRASLIDKEVRERDVFDEEIVITRCGGGRTIDADTGKMHQTTDQQRSQGNSKSPSKLPHYYNVLGWFHVTDVWVEIMEGCRTWCVRMEKIRLGEKSWWATAGSPLPNPYRVLNAIKAAALGCLHCKTTSKAIFEQGWACLKSSCDKFFVFDPPVDDQKLNYSEAFLKERTAYSGITPGPLAPPLITEADMITTGRSGTEFAFRQGIVCPVCKGCSRRIQWSKWSCETVGCGFTHSLTIRTISVKDTMRESERHRRQQNYEHEFGIKFEAKRLGAYNVFEYGVPGPDGKVVGVIRLFKSEAAINKQPDGPDDLFQLIQVRDFDLRRRPARQANSSGEVITNHFATNWGAPYKFVVAQSSRGFSEAPIVIIKALKRLTWAGEQTLTDAGESFQPFNELLSVGYFEDGSIGYHDDGESTLGPTVATLSLGASATMSLRPKAKAAVGITSRNAKGTKAPILRVTLEHGDMVIMHGSGVQQYYEHEVVPNGSLRFALTCRYIRSETLSSDAEREEARIKGALPEGHEQYNYDGNGDVIFSQEEMEKVEMSERLNTLRRMANDTVAIYKVSEAKGNANELRQIRDLLGEVGEPMTPKDSMEEDDVPMINAP